jgi:hypothetical protein
VCEMDILLGKERNMVYNLLGKAGKLVGKVGKVVGYVSKGLMIRICFKLSSKLGCKRGLQ